MALGLELDENMPFNKYIEYFGPRFKLEVPSSNMDDQNSAAYIENIKYGRCSISSTRVRIGSDLVFVSFPDLESSTPFETCPSLQVQECTTFPITRSERKSES